MDAQNGENVGKFLKETVKDVTQYNDIVEERAREFATNPLFRKKEDMAKRRQAFFSGRVSAAQLKAQNDKQLELCKAQVRNHGSLSTPTAPESLVNQNARARNPTFPAFTSTLNRDAPIDPSSIKPLKACKHVKKAICTPTLRITRRSIDQWNRTHQRNPSETKSLPVTLQKSSQPLTKSTASNIRGEQAISRNQEGVKKSEPGANVPADDSPSVCDLAEINPSPHRRNAARRYSSYFNLHKKSSDFNLHDQGTVPSARKRSKLKKKDHSKHKSGDHRSHRKRSRSARLRSRRRSRRLSAKRGSVVISANEPKDLMPNENAAELTPLMGPISVDSIRKLKKNGEQLNVIQVYRIYGSGAVEQAYENLPRRSATKWARGAMASVKYGKNMVEITIINTDIQASKRGRLNKWIFIKDMGHKTLPILFGKTVLVKTHSPAPFCLSISAPFYVSAHQEQHASPDGGDRFRESIELRSCQNSGMPTYEMKPLHDPNHSIFNEHVFLGKGLVRIDSVTNIPPDQKLEALLSQSNDLTITRQYRIELPWRQRDSSVSSEIPRAPQIKDILPTSHFKKRAKSDQFIPTSSDPGTSTGLKLETFHGRRIAPPLSADIYGFNVELPENQVSCNDRRKRLKRSCSTTSQSSTFSTTTHSDDDCKIDFHKKNSDIPSMNNRVFPGPPNDLLLSSDSAKTTKSPAVTSSTEVSSREAASREVFVMKKPIECVYSKKNHLNLPGLIVKNKKEPPTLKRYEPNPPKMPEKSDNVIEKSTEGKSKDSKQSEKGGQIEEKVVTVSPAPTAPVPSQELKVITLEPTQEVKEFTSSPALSEYSPRAEKDVVVGEVVRIEVVKTPPGLREIHKLHPKNGISYKFHRSRSTKQSKSMKKKKHKRETVSPDAKSDTRQLPPDHSPLRTLLTAKQLVDGQDIDSVAVKGKLPDGSVKIEMQLSSKLMNQCKLTPKSPYQSDHNLTT